MGKGISKFIIGLFVAVLGSLIPVLGIPFVIIGAILMMWGLLQFYLGVGKAIVKGTTRAVGAGGRKGTGRL